MGELFVLKSSWNDAPYLTALLQYGIRNSSHQPHVAAAIHQANASFSQQQA
jgi:hypothetical protein